MKKMHSRRNKNTKSQIKYSQNFKLNASEFLRLCIVNREVFYYIQNEIEDTGKYALCFVGTDFWIDTCSSIEFCRKLAKKLSLKIINTRREKMGER